MPSKCFSLSVPVHLIDPISLKGISSEDFLFFFPSCLATPPPHAPRHRPIILLLNSLPPSPSQLANIPPPSIPAQFADSFLFLCWGSPFLLMSVVSAHGAAPSQLNAAPPSQTSNQNKERSILCCLMFIKAADIRAASTSAAPQRLRHETTGFCNIRRDSWRRSSALLCLF